MTYFEHLYRIASDASQDGRLEDLQSALDCLEHEVWGRWTRATDSLTPSNTPTWDQ